MPEPIHDPANYRKMLEPFASPDEANAALSAFLEDVRAARNKHRIANVLTAVEMRVTYESGEGSVMVHATQGDPLMAEPLAAFAFGRVQAERREVINTLVAGKGTKKAS